MNVTECLALVEEMLSVLIVLEVFSAPVLMATNFLIQEGIVPVNIYLL